jgi:hypothetical protein
VTFDFLDADHQIHRIIRTSAGHEHPLLDLLPAFHYKEWKQPPAGLVVSSRKRASIRFRSDVSDSLYGFLSGTPSLCDIAEGS